MNLKGFSPSKTFKGIIVGIGVVVAVLLVFQAGMFVGYRKAAFSYHWGEDYYRTFGGQRKNAVMGIPRDDFFNAHGASGRIIKIDLPTFVLEDQGRVEKVVLIKDDTAIMRFRDTLKPADLKADDFVVVIGSPNDQAQVEARLIRVMPEPPAEAPPMDRLPPMP